MKNSIILLKEDCKKCNDCLYCNNRRMCQQWLNNGVGRKVPCNSDLDEMVTFFEKLDKKVKMLDIQNFVNNVEKYGYKSSHVCRNFYNRLKLHYCKKKGFKMCSEWLDFQEFCLHWDKNTRNGEKPMFNKKFNIIDENSLTFA